MLPLIRPAALVIYHTARWLFALTTGCIGLFVGLSIRGIKTYSLRQACNANPCAALCRAHIAGSRHQHRVTAFKRPSPSQTTETMHCSARRVLRMSRAYLVCCIIILLSDLNPLSYGKASWASTITAGACAWHNAHVILNQCIRPISPPRQCAMHACTLFRAWHQVPTPAWLAPAPPALARAALSGAGFAPLPLDIYAVYIAWSMQKKLHDQREVLGGLARVVHVSSLPSVARARRSIWMLLGGGQGRILHPLLPACWYAAPCTPPSLLMLSPHQHH